MTGVERMEARRLSLQAALDAQKDAAARNRLGQFATPTALAREMLAYGCTLLGQRQTIRFLDPAIGTGSFYSALRAVAPADAIGRCQGFDVDPHYAEPAIALWRNTPLALRIADFLAIEPPRSDTQRANLLICNPPYVRHHHIDGARKRALREATMTRVALRPSGLSGLYCYFLWLSHAWLAPGAVAGWLIPSEWMDVNYGAVVKAYLCDRVRLVRIHRFDPCAAQFGDALVSSSMVWFRNLPPSDDPVELTFGGSLAAPDRRAAVPPRVLRAARKWTPLMAAPTQAMPRPASRQSRPASRPASRPTSKAEFAGASIAGIDHRATLGELFAIKRGVATGANAFFILSPARVEQIGVAPRFLRPILPSPRYLETDEIEAEPDGAPAIVRKRFLLAVDEPEHTLRSDHPALWAYLASGMAAGIHERYLTRHRSPWYTQEQRPAAPLLCTYMGRATHPDARPFRFIHNASRATAANVYLLLYPRPALAQALTAAPGLLRSIWRALCRIPARALISEGRVYGGGLHKLEPKELSRLPLATLGALSA